MAALTACGSAGPLVQGNGASLRIVRPTQDQVLPVHSLAVQVEVASATQFRLHYYLDGADQGEGDTSITLSQLSPGRHRLEVELRDGAGKALSPPLRAGADFTIQ